MKRPVTTTSQSAKNSSVAVLSGTPTAVVSMTTFEPGVGIQQRLGGHRGLDVDERREEVDVDEHGVGGIGSLGSGLGDDATTGSPT